MKMENTQQVARALYAEQGMEAADIARLTNTKKDFIDEWIKVGEWDKLRSSHNLSPKNLVDLYYQQSEAIMKKASDDQRPLSLKEVQALDKLATCIQKIDKRLDIGAVVNVLKGFTDFLYKANAKMAQELVKYEMDYARHLMREKKN